MRSPLTDPKPGDVIQPPQYHTFPKPAQVRVSAVIGELLAAIREGDVFWVTIDHWRHIYKRAKVLHASE